MSIQHRSKLKILSFTAKYEYIYEISTQHQSE